ncbi:MAG: Twin-arginine translocation protein TatC [uncultured Aureispira sp.]|uniref:Sec-independent protein translocase protein TatC n=1 Tax=uncultured Aureispira sp. TaxID=1331704 RepID=A0A6S6SS89_9BACT|nr:MAG: Twin-arginine translocation protein TatC [uncultured Aureispira sp.]
MPDIANTSITADKEEEEKEMSFIEHLEELRIHLIRIAISVCVSAVFIFFATKSIFTKVIFGPLNEDFLTYQLMCKLSHWLELGDQMCYSPTAINLVTLEMGEAFLLHIKVCIFGGLILSFPFVLWEFWKFIKPGLYPREQKAANGVVLVSSLLFLMGISFGYFILAPFAINFLVGYELPMINAANNGNLIKATSLINYMIMFTVPVGIIFEMPIIVYYLSKMGLITDAFMREYRRHAIVLTLVVAAFVTPPDVMTQIIIGIPIYILYELSIHIAAKQTKKRADEMNS